MGLQEDRRTPIQSSGLGTPFRDSGSPTHPLLLGFQGFPLLLGFQVYPPTPFRVPGFPTHPLPLGFQGAREGQDGNCYWGQTPPSCCAPIPAASRRGQKNYLDVIFPALSGLIGGRERHFGGQKKCRGGQKNIFGGREKEAGWPAPRRGSKKQPQAGLESKKQPWGPKKLGAPKHTYACIYIISTRVYICVYIYIHMYIHIH